MANTTKANVLIIAPELSTVADGTFTLFLADVAEEITTQLISEEAQEKAQRYLAAHLLTLHSGGVVGNVKSETAGRASITYAGDNMFDPDMLSKTKYGAEFWRYFKKNRSLIYL